MYAAIDHRFQFSNKIVLGSIMIILVKKTGTPIVGFCNWSMFCSALPYVHSGFAIILMGEESWLLCVFVFLILVIVVRLFLAVSWVCLQFVIVVFSDQYALTIFDPEKLPLYAEI